MVSLFHTYRKEVCDCVTNYIKNIDLLGNIAS